MTTPGPRQSAAATVRPDVLRLVVADDEPVALRRLVRLLREEPGLEVVAACGGGAAALAAARAHRPDAVLLDVEMPELDGLAVARRLAAEPWDAYAAYGGPAVVFVTAYDAYAIEAFRVQALDYVLKPIDRDQVRDAVARARRAADLARAARAVSAADATVSGHPGPTIPQLTVRDGFAEHRVAVRDIRYVESCGNYVRVHTARRRLLHRGTMERVAAMLAPHGFVRVHRAAIVNVGCVTGLRRRAGGRCDVMLDGDVRLRVSRTQRAVLRESLDARST